MLRVVIRFLYLSPNNVEDSYHCFHLTDFYQVGIHLFNNRIYNQYLSEHSSVFSPPRLPPNPSEEANKAV